MLINIFECFVRNNSIVKAKHYVNKLLCLQSSCLEDYVANRLILLDKSPGVRTIGLIGEIVWLENRWRKILRWILKRQLVLFKFVLDTNQEQRQQSMQLNKFKTRKTPKEFCSSMPVMPLMP